MLETGLKMGFGLMRLPKNEDGSLSVEQTSIMVDRFLQAGGTYFDTAFAYGGSEECIRKALVERYPRDRYTLTSKLIAFGPDMTEEKAKDEINITLKRLGTEYLDLYLLHALQRSNIDFYDRWNLWDYVKQLKEEGKIRHYGFSFHADPDLLEELLNKHPDVEFVQLQINYADWENPGVNSKKNLEICKAHNKPVIVMEPVKGGILADPIDTVKTIFDAEGNDVSYAGWALRFAASQDNIFTVLNGASSVEQITDSLKYMAQFVPLNEHENEVIKKAQAALDADQSIPCTGCHYCTKGCPMNIPIPEIFTVENRKAGSPEFRTKREYSIVTNGKGKASECIQCGQCEAACPQHLEIISLLEKCRAFED
ncbi:MAG: aldo/keto reductase [Erysipelotrichaceae bacterium]|nr:aldo/keto reductase [Erysipelotrichaceae bacterium]